MDFFLEKNPVILNQTKYSIPIKECQLFRKEGREKTNPT
jgi:hypothetical protein